MQILTWNFPAISTFKDTYSGIKNTSESHFGFATDQFLKKNFIFFETAQKMIDEEQ